MILLFTSRNAIIELKGTIVVHRNADNLGHRENNVDGNARPGPPKDRYDDPSRRSSSESRWNRKFPSSDLTPYITVCASSTHPSLVAFTVLPVVLLTVKNRYVSTLSNPGRLGDDGDASSSMNVSMIT